jgi:hypothetical protein
VRREPRPASAHAAQGAVALSPLLPGGERLEPRLSRLPCLYLPAGWPTSQIPRWQTLAASRYSGRTTPWATWSGCEWRHSCEWRHACRGLPRPLCSGWALAASCCSALGASSSALQALLDTADLPACLLCRQLHRDKAVVFAGYRIPHPLEYQMVIKVCSTQTATPHAPPANALGAARPSVGTTVSKSIYQT